MLFNLALQITLQSINFCSVQENVNIHMFMKKCNE